MKRKHNDGFGSDTPGRMLIRRTIFLMAAFGVLAFGVLVVRLFVLQVSDHEYYEELAAEQQTRGTSVTASRGTIYDRNMRILAMSATAENVYISPAELSMYGENAEFIAKALAEILGKDYEKVLEKAKNTSSWYQTVATKVEQETADLVREFISANDIKSVRLETTTKRYYPYSSLLSHVVGFVGTDNYGLGGIEAVYDDVLTGVSGRTIRTTTSAGTELLYSNFEDYEDAEEGQSLVLTTDSTIQHYLEKYLKKALSDYDIENGAAGIVMDVKTGGVLAMASFGDFDLNNYLDVSDEVRDVIDGAQSDEEKSNLLYEAQQAQWRNKAISDTYEPGSTFKIITLAMALEEDVVDLSSSFGCGGSVAVIGRNKPVKCWKTTGHGSQTLTQAVQHSCNVAFVNIGMKVGPQKFYDYIKSFGFFDKTGIDLPGEGSSLWWSRELFCDSGNLSQLAAASFGQTFNITPLQLITAVSAVANGGYLMKPHIVEAIADSEGNIVSKNEPTVVRQVVSESTSKTVCSILEQVVSGAEGTGKNAYVAGYRVAGKTGTSEKVAQDAAGGDKEYIVSFVGIAPADDPQIAVLVLLDTPGDGSGVYVSGGQMAAPVVGGIMSEVLPYIGVEAVYSDEETEVMDKTVPDVAGMTVDAAKSALEGQEFSVRVIGTGSVATNQLPAAGATVAAGSEIIIYAGGSPSDGVETMPSIVGMTYAQAREYLKAYAVYVSSGDCAISAGSSVAVSSQSVEAGADIKYGTVVEVSLADKSNLGRY